LKFRVEINCDNDAFNSPRPEIVRILKQIEAELEMGIVGASPIRDINGNTCGRWQIIGRKT